MQYEDTNEWAAALERAARREPRAQVAAVLRLAAALVQNDHAASEHGYRRKILRLVSRRA